MRKIVLYFILLILVTSNSYSQWNTVNEIQHYVNSIQTKNDSLFVATNNGVFCIDSLSNVTLLDNDDTIKNVYKLKVIEDNIYAVSGEVIYRFSSLENDWDSVCPISYDYWDFYLKDSIVAITRPISCMVKNIYNDSIIYSQWSNVISFEEWYGSIEYYNNKFFVFSFSGGLRIIGTDKQVTYLDSDKLMSDSTVLAATRISKMTDDLLYAAYPLSSKNSGKSRIVWYDYKTSDSVSFNDSAFFNRTLTCMDVYNDGIYVGGESGIISKINPLTKEITLDTIPNTSYYISEITVNENCIYAVVNGELYFKEVQNSISNSKTQYASREKLHVYPTISENVIKIDNLIENSEYTIKIVNINGTTVYNEKMKYANTPLTIKIDNLSKGTYIVQVLSDEKHESSYIIKK